MKNPQAPDDRSARIQALARRLLETEAELRALTDGQLDAIVDPDSATPLLLRGAQDALRDSEARARALVERLPTMAAELAPDGTTRFVNDAVTRILGYQPEDLVRRPWWATLGVSGDAARRDLAAEDMTEHEQSVTARDGSRRDAVWSSARALAPDGTLRAILLFGVDITERRRAEQAAYELVREQAARAEAEASERRAALLSEAGRLLGSALRYEATLTSIARLAVTGIAEYCIVDVVEDDTGPRRVDVAHPDIEVPDPLRERLAQAAPGDGGLRMIEHVIGEGQTRTVPAGDHDALAEVAGDGLVEDLAGRAIVCAPSTLADRPLAPSP
jgi:PAS domain S-box-containing protein